MKNTLVKGLKKMVFAGTVALALVSVAPKNTEAATVKMDRTKVTCVAKERFTLKVKGANGKKVTWTSSKPSVATVSRKGNVVTKKAGKATIKAKVAKKTVKCTVTVKKNASKPYKVYNSKTIRVGESFLLIEGSCVDYQSVFSFNDRIATVDGATGRVTGTGVGTVKILVNRGQDKKGNYRDYYCTVNVVAGTASTCKHEWMDTNSFNSNGKNKGPAFVIKTHRDEAYDMCNTCGQKFFDSDDLDAHQDSVNAKGGVHHGGSTQSGGATGHNIIKFGTQYCNKCGLEK